MIATRSIRARPEKLKGREQNRRAQLHEISVSIRRVDGDEASTPLTRKDRFRTSNQQQRQRNEHEEAAKNYGH